MDIDWSGCDLVEAVPGKVSGVPVVKHSRVPADTVAESAELGETPEEIAYNYDLDVEDVRQVLAYAYQQNPDHQGGLPSPKRSPRSQFSSSSRLIANS